MSQVEIHQVYNHKRFFGHGYNSVYTLLYLPVGLFLVLFRALVGLLVLLLGFFLPDVPIVNNILTKLLCITFGVTVDVVNSNRQEDVDVFVSNQISPFDHLVVHSVTKSVSPGSNKLNSVLSTSFGIRYFGSFSSFDNLKKNISALIAENKVPLYIQPEFRMTNGNVILKFKTWPFTLTKKVQPICVTISRPFDITVTTFNSNQWTDAFFYLFSPYTSYKVKFLPAVEKNELSESEFAERVRSEISSNLQIIPVEYSANDLFEWEKRHRVDQQRPRRPVNSPTVNNELHLMTKQVREVLPLVPYNVVYKDLVKTRSVDVTITNVLEGHLQYTPETVPVDPAPSTSIAPICKETPSGGLITAASSFGKSAHERTLSFQERKEQLIENARKKYIEKHGLNTALNNC